MDRKMVKMALVGCMLFVSGFANAGIEYDFVCDDPTCGGNNDWGGSFEIAESAALNLSPFSYTSIISFNFTSPDQNGISWDLAGLFAGIRMRFSADSKSIMSITSLNSLSCQSPASSACFASRGHALYVSAHTVFDRNFTTQRGRWLAREVSGPSTIVIFALGIWGLAFRRTKKQS